jgi:cytochrome c oxidase subunit 3
MTDSAVTVAEQFETKEQQLRADLTGIWIFLATEVLFFGGMFAAYAVYRSSYPHSFAVAAGHLKLLLGSVNTVILLTSSLAMSMTDPAMEEQRRGRALAMIALALFLGLAFLAVKDYEYRVDFSEGTAPFAGFDFDYHGPDPAHAKTFFSFYFALTGLHAMHMIVGIVLLSIMFVRVWRWRKPGDLVRPVRIVGLYWAFVDIVWTFVFPMVYLLRS